jgi:hypothetical protein
VWSLVQSCGLDSVCLEVSYFTLTVLGLVRAGLVFKTSPACNAVFHSFITVTLFAERYIVHMKCLYYPHKCINDTARVMAWSR